MMDLACWVMGAIDQEKRLTHSKVSAHAAWAKIEAYRHVLDKIDEISPRPARKKGRRLPITANYNPDTWGVELSVGKKEVGGITFCDDYGEPYMPRHMIDEVGRVVAEVINANGTGLRAAYDNDGGPGRSRAPASETRK